MSRAEAFHGIGSCVALLYVRIITELLPKRLLQVEDLEHNAAKSGDFAEQGATEF